MSVDGVNDLQKPRPKPTTPRPMKTRAFLSPTSRGRPLGPKCCWNQVDSPTPLPVRTHLVDDAVHNERVFQYVLPNPRVERQSSRAFQLPALLEPLAAATARPRLDLRHRGGRRPTGLGHDSGPKAAPPGPHVGSAPGTACTCPRCIPEGPKSSWKSNSHT